MRSKEDQMIDAALAGYSRVDPPEGQERRVWQRIDGRRVVRRRIWCGLAAAAAAAALLAVVLRDGHSERPAPPKAIVYVMPPGLAAVSPAPRVIHHRKRLRPRQFPLPAPLTGEERALLAFVTEHPATAAKLQSGEPIEIQPIEIKPLPGDGDQ